MPTADWINAFFFSLFAVIAWLGHWPQRVRIGVTAIGAAGIAAILAARSLEAALAPATPAVVGDWLPAPLMLVVYWQVGQFEREPDEKLQTALMKLDQRALAAIQRHPKIALVQGWIGSYLELAYLSCYVLVPLGVAVLCGIGRKDYTDEYWTIVLPAAYLCYPLLPFAQVLPPRMLEPDANACARPGKIRALNLWLLRGASIQINTFPSAHVAATSAAALALCRVSPVAGLVFLWVAASIAIGAVAGRYHYAADAFLGALLAIAVFLLDALFRS